MQTRPILQLVLAAVCLAHFQAAAASAKAHYYGHDAVADSYGVIAPWYQGLNGQCDLRVRIAAETLKRYPWTTTNQAIAAYPDYVFSGHWQITSNGVIVPQTPSDWDNGDIGQRSTSVLMGWVDYYRYSGDPAAIEHLTYMGDFLLDCCQTPPDHPWPGFLISVPVKGKAYWKCNTNGMIQLDISANMGQGLLRAYQLTGNRRWFDAARHWGDLLAARCNLDPNADPWPRYANPETAPWKDNKQTGGVTMILAFLDELIRLGYTGEGGQLLKAREAGLRYVRDRLLPAWLADDTWGRYFWDWPNPTQNCSTTADVAGYLVSHPREFPNWRNDARNILTLFLNHSSAAPQSGGDVFNGAWAYPESSSCCGRSLWYAPLLVGGTMAQYGVAANDSWMRELAYRQMILQTYDIHETGVTEDNIDGGIIVNGSWLNIAHPLPLRWVLTAIGWLPEELGASRENHIVRSSAVVNSVRYGVGRIEYSTFDAPQATMEVLRLSYAPREITADGHALRRRHDLRANGYTVRKLANGDAIVQVRHDGARRVSVTGNDPQHLATDQALSCDTAWVTQADAAAPRSTWRAAETKDATLTATFVGNQVRLLGRADEWGGLAEVYVDEVKQLVPVDCWNPSPRSQQVLYYQNGLANGSHTLRIVARGMGNPYSKGTRIYVDAVQFSAESAACSFPTGTGPTGPQRMIFGFPGRQDYRDTLGHLWRPGTEVVTRLAAGKDTVAACWWTNAVSEPITGTPDPALYRYGCHARDFWVNLTVGPGSYCVRLKFAARRESGSQTNCFSISLNGEEMIHSLDVRSAAGGLNQALDVVFDQVAPRNGVLSIRFTGLSRAGSGQRASGEAFLQALEVEPVSTRAGRSSSPLVADQPAVCCRTLIPP
jgi:Malectin domain